MSILGIRHVGLVVKDLRAAVTFYVHALGFMVVDQNIESGAYLDVMLDLPGAEACIVKLAAPDGNRLELLSFTSHFRDPQPKDLCSCGYSHIAFTVHDLDKIYAHLKAHGVPFLSEPQLTTGGYRVVFCKDPESNFIELVEAMH